jgi:arylformamidase
MFTVQHLDRTYTFDPQQPLDISMPLQTGHQGAECFWAEPMEINTIRVGTFVGSVAEGGACNYQRLHITPHGNGTHTECYGHISADPNATIQNCLKRFLFVAVVVSVPVEKLENGDSIIKLAALEEILKTHSHLQPEAVVLRTLPNSDEKLTHHYSGSNPTYLEPGIGALLADAGIQHLLLDLPSVDRESDEGKLINHHQFWRYPSQPRCGATITELIYVPETVADGIYLLNLQITSLPMDASSSKPVLYALK